MQKVSIDISYDPETKYYSALILDYGLTTQSMTLDGLKENLEEAIGLHNHVPKSGQLSRFTLSATV